MVLYQELSLVSRPQNSSTVYYLESPYQVQYFAILGGVSRGFAQFYGGTSLLIMVGVILDTLQQIESYLLMRHYEGMMKSGRVRGRSQNTVLA